MGKRGAALIFLLCSFLSYAAPTCKSHCTALNKDGEQSLLGKKKSNFFFDAVKDILVLHKNLFSISSYKIIVETFPFFVAGSLVDERINKYYYCDVHHKNINQFPCWVHTLSKYAIAVPIVGLGSLFFFSRNEDIHETARIFLLGAPFVIFEKDLIKKMRFEKAMRPWNGNFDKKKRCYGGFPSGHLAEVSYAAVLWGMRHGLKYGVPLGVLGVFVGTSFINWNRHYLSQLFAGVGFGAMFAVAASKIVDEKLKSKDVTFDLSTRDHGGTEVKLSYRF